DTNVQEGAGEQTPPLTVGRERTEVGPPADHAQWLRVQGVDARQHREAEEEDVETKQAPGHVDPRGRGKQGSVKGLDASSLLVGGRARNVESLADRLDLFQSEAQEKQVRPGLFPKLAP